jgi:gliding motility-associated lipoprotein GldD
MAVKESLTIKIHMKTLKIFTVFLLLTSCGQEQITIPKPPTYLRLNLPNRKYVQFSDNCPYSFDVSTLFKVEKVKEKGLETCHKDIQLGSLNGIIHFSYIDMVEPLSKYVNYSNDKVDEHKIKATSIEDVKILRPKDRVFGTFFELKGDVATPFQFYLTDSLSRFVSGVVYFNSVPNYDSLRPSIEYLKVDLMRMVNTFKWKKK